ncbi:hypothetical protein [Sporocytophaga myxococcoides]|uniref:hypothetical protein n=1 Tax=Sporocytophaga myxococcoides TaxID=153721 RepID=UPI00040B2ECB|nr:hypothetical protein [Sporocytophaga myxococcoides]
MKLKLNISLCCLLMIGLIACHEEAQNDTKEVVKDTVVVPPKDTVVKEEPKHEEVEQEKVVDLGLTKDDKKNLMVINELPLGTPFKKIKELFPSLKDPRPEGGSADLAKQGYSEASVKLDLMGKKTDLEFNLKNDTLYSYFYTVSEADYEKASDLYLGIQQFYNKQFGTCKEENVEEYNHYSKSCMWNPGKFSLIMTQDINNGTVSWGFQRPVEF